MKFAWLARCVLIAFGIPSFVFGATPSFTTVSPMITARSQHTATLLQNGMVLVAGGESDGGGTIQTAEIYDPVADAWSSAGILNAARKRHSAILLPDGTVLVAGGLGNAGTLLSSEIYDPVANTWSTVGSFHASRQDFTLTLLPNNKILAAGGDTQASVGGTATALLSAEIYDPTSSTWTPATSMTTARYYHTATLLQNNKVLVASGATSASETTTVAELYDYVSNTWAATGAVATGQAQAVATQVTFGNVVIAAGISGSTILKTAQLYDAQLTTWRSTGSLIIARTLHTGTLLNTGLFLAVGGFDGSNTLFTTELYDPSSGVWNPSAMLNAARKYHTATLLQNGKVLVAGGINQIELSSVELYDTGVVSGPLTLASGPTAAPNPAAVGQTVSFSATATGGTGTLTYTWSFGDGSGGTGSTTTHVYTTTGGYTASVTVTDTTNTSVSGNTTVTITAAGNANIAGIGPDDDGDGFSNTLEEIMQSDPENAASVPLNVTNPTAPVPLTVTFLQSRIVFPGTGNDRLGCRGLLPLPAGFVVTGAKVGIDVSGVGYLAHLGPDGRSDDIFQLQFKGNPNGVPAQTARFTYSLRRGTFAAILAQSGLVNQAVRNIAVTLKVSVFFNGTFYQRTVPQVYNARQNRYGVSKK